MSRSDAEAGPMVGVRVVELAAWVAGPAAGAVLADWGAEVVKVEPVHGDPFRYMVKLGTEGMNPPFELDNRGKRAIGLDVTTPDGRAVFDELLARADVFLSNLRPGTLEGLDLAPEQLHERFPRLVVATINGFGDDGPDRDRPSYDVGGFWARSGLAASHTFDGGEPPQLRGAAGDHMSAMSLVAGISAALFARDRTGEGRHVSTSLLRNGVYALGQDVNVRLRAGISFPMGGGRRAATNPLYNTFRTADGRWIWLLGLQPDRHWPLITVALDHPEWLADERFDEMASRRENAPALLELLDATFADRTLEEWVTLLDEAGVWFEAVRTIDEVVEDPQVRAAGALVAVCSAVADETVPSVASPVDFDGTSRSDGRPSPELAEHTREILLELGRTTDQIRDLEERGVIATT
jgi:crotonobetainyl-CoA:carnitine CoA-transferase CaiB-like acyl-CoA transferase